MTSVIHGSRNDDNSANDDDQDSSASEEEQSQQDSGGGIASRVKQMAGQDRHQPGLVKNRHVIEEDINVGVSHEVAYRYWTDYDQWSEIFKKESAKASESDNSGDGDDGEQDGDGDDESREKVTVNSKIGPSRRQMETEIVERDEGRRLAWRSRGGPRSKGVVTFHGLDDHLTQVMVDIEYVPSGLFETVGNFFRMQRRRVRKDLKLFKNYAEIRSEPVDGGDDDSGEDER